MPGWKSIIVCDGVDVPCTFSKFVELINVAIYDLILISTLLAVCGFIYAGGLLLASGGNEKAKGTAKNIFWNDLGISVDTRRLASGLHYYQCPPETGIRISFRKTKLI